jgi:hypothetical protein
MHMEVRYRLLCISATRMEKIYARCSYSRSVMQAQHLSHAEHAREKMLAQVPERLVMDPGSDKGVSVRLKAERQEGHDLAVLVRDICLSSSTSYCTERAPLALHVFILSAAPDALAPSHAIEPFSTRCFV